jgi:DNA-binding protein YbaB
MFEKAKQLYQLQKKAKQIKKQLKNTHIEAEFEGIIVIINGEQEVVEVKFADEFDFTQKDFSKNLVKAFNKAVKKSQEVAANMMKEVMGDLSLPGM